MQNLMIGSSGSGKGYESCVFQILPALQSGRLVITNMPLDIDRWAAIDMRFRDLIQVRKSAQPIRGTWEPTREDGAFNLWEDGRVLMPPPTARPFAGVWDYYTDWKHPETGQGPLFIVDEAQNCIPAGKTDVQVEEWSALHRHFNVDIIWVTQSYGKLSKAVRDNIQLVYRLRKKTAWGQPDRYIRKVQDGIRGEVMTTEERRYEKKYFGLWRSHTQGLAAEEFSGSDIKPFYHHWTFRGAATCFFLFVAIIMYQVMFMDSPIPTAQKPGQIATRTVRVEPPPAAQTVETVEQEEPEVSRVHHPYINNTLHLQGIIRTDDRLLGMIAVAQNGQPVSVVSFDDMRSAGYRIQYHSDQVVSLTYSNQDLGFVTMDLPKVSMTPANL